MLENNRVGPGEVLRLAMLRTHYRQPIDWTVRTLEEAERTLDRWYDHKEETSAAAAGRLIDLQTASRSTGIVAASVLGLPHLALMKDIVDAGEIGEIFQIHCSWQLSFFLKIMPGFPYLWFGKRGQGVSVTRNHGSHMLHALRHIAGPIDAVCSNIDTRLKQWELPGGAIQVPETDDCCHSMLRFASGAMGTLATSWVAADSPGFHLDVLGSKGRIRLEAVGYPSVSSASIYLGKADLSMVPSGAVITVPDTYFTVGGSRLQTTSADDFNGGQRISIARLFERFVAAIDSGAEPLGSFSRAAEVQEVVEALYASQQENRWIDTCS